MKTADTDPRPAVTVRNTWQGWIVQDPFMPDSIAIGIYDDRGAAIEAAEDWAIGADLRVEVQA